MLEEGRGTPEKTIRVALIGAGKMAMHHARAIRMQTEATLVAVADPIFGEKEFSAFLGGGIESFSRAEDLLNDVKPDVIHICTPPETHETLAKLALNHGAHIYVEKPFTLRSREALEVISLAKEKKRKVCSGHQLLFESPTLRVEESLQKIGRIVSIESYFSFNPVRRSKDGRGAISPLDQLVDILPHPVYLLLHFLKKKSRLDKDPVEIRALEVSPTGSVYGILRCGNVMGNLCVTLEGRPIDSYIKIIGTNGSILADYVRGAVIELPGPGKSAISKIINPYKQSMQIINETTSALSRRVFKKQKSYPGLYEIIRNFYRRISDEKSNDEYDDISILDTVSICEEVGNRLRIAERDENARDEFELKRMESGLSAPERSRGIVLVTGGTGMLGKAVARELRKRNWHTRVIARKIPSVSARVPGVEYVTGDLAENVPPGIFEDVSTVVHCAAETAGGREAHERNSVNATRNILTATAKSGVKKFIHISSIAVLQTSRQTGGPVAENTPLVLEKEDRGPYVWGKAESERLVVEMGSELGVEIKVIRPGPLLDFDNYEPPGRLGREVGPLFIYFGTGNSRLCICDVQTAADVICKYVEDFHSMPTVLNLIEPDAPTRAELVSKLLKIRPDLRAIPFPLFMLRTLSPGLKLLQRILRRGQKPVDIYAAFSSERYNSSLAADIIKVSTQTP